MQLLVKTFHGLENVLAEELKAFGASNVKTIRRAVSCTGGLDVIYKVNYCSRCALSVLWQLREGRVRHEQALYDLMQSVKWSDYFKVSSTFRMDLVCFSDRFRNTLYLSQLCKDAVVDQFRDRFGRRPNVSKSPHVRINVYVGKERTIISLDTSGAALFRRGYRMHTAEAPINEVLAAGMIKIAGWNSQDPLMDPMCGSGTIPLEAALMAKGVPAQYFREEDFSLQYLTNFDEELWRQLRKEANQKIGEELPIEGFDLDNRMLRLARKNANSAEIEGITWKRADFKKLKPQGAPGIIICNPPYDERLPLEDAQRFYQMMGDTLKQHFSGWKAWILTGHEEGSKSIGLRPSNKLTLFNGALECRFLGFELYEGTRKGEASE